MNQGRDTKLSFESKLLVVVFLPLSGGSDLTTRDIEKKVRDRYIRRYSRHNHLAINILFTDTSDDILAKYRKKPDGVVSNPGDGDSADVSRLGTSMNTLNIQLNSTLTLNSTLSQVFLSDQTGSSETSGSTVEFSPFEDAKKKLRLVLSNADSSMPLMVNNFMIQ